MTVAGGFFRSVGRQIWPHWWRRAGPAQVQALHRLL